MSKTVFNAMLRLRRRDFADHHIYLPQTTIRTETVHERDTEPFSEKPVALKDASLHPENDLDNNIIGWDSQDDPENPK